MNYSSENLRDSEDLDEPVNGFFSKRSSNSGERNYDLSKIYGLVSKSFSMGSPDRYRIELESRLEVFERLNYPIGEDLKLLNRDQKLLLYHQLSNRIILEATLAGLVPQNIRGTAKRTGSM